ncbi:MAG: formyl transferase [Pseudomonadota bacterium]
MDIWRCGFIARPLQQLLGGWPDAVVHWFPEQPAGRFLADPFGWQQGETLHVFAEALDYRSHHGTIERWSFDSSGRLLESRPALREAWHLSYPLVFEAEGAVWMLPEAHRSGTLTLYRGDDKLERWQPETSITLDAAPVDATPLWHAGRWWLFYTPAGPKPQHLHVAWSGRLTGPWHAHPLNPVRVDAAGARPAGRAVIIDGRIMLPVQDCTSTYGGAVRPLWIDRLDEREFSASLAAPLALPPGAGNYRDGMHTLSASGDWTVFDVKRVDRSGRGLLYDLQRYMRPSG